MSAELSYAQPATTTIPKDIIGENTHQLEDHGPYYMFSPGQTIHRVDARDSCPHIYPGRIATVISWGHWKDDEESAPNAVQTRRVQGQGTGSRAQKLNPIYAGSTVRDILQTYGEYGVINIRALGRQTVQMVKPEVLSEFLYPYSCEWEFTREGYITRVDPRIAEEAQKQGGLAVRLRWVKEARQTVREPEFGERHGAQLQELYIAALDEIEASFTQFRTYALRELAESEDLIRRHRGNGVGKPSYDMRDLYFLWLTGREEVDILRGSATQKQPEITVNVPPPPALDLNAVKAMVEAVTAAVLAAQGGPAAPAVTVGAPTVAVVEPEPAKKSDKRKNEDEAAKKPGPGPRVN